MASSRFLIAVALPLSLPATAALAQSNAHPHAGPQASPHAHAPAPPVPARMELAVGAADLAGLPRHDAPLDVHGRKQACTGVELADLLRRAGAMPDGPLRGAHLVRTVQAQARDGYRVAFSLAELDPTLGRRHVYVVDQCDGRALDAQDGPLRLVVPEDARAARSLRQLQSLVVE